MDIIARSGHATDILDARDDAITGDNVRVPEGKQNLWDVGESWIEVEIPAGINLCGAPTPRGAVVWGNRTYYDQVLEWKTILVMPYDVPTGAMWFRFLGSGDRAKPSRFSDIKLVGYRDIDPNSITRHLAIQVYNVVDFRIDHSFFKHTTSGVGIGGPPNSVCRGVIDHCKLINEYGVGAPYEELTIGYGVMPSRPGTSEWEDNIDNVLGRYTDYSVFMEDCYFSRWRHCVASAHGAHYVFRHNTIEHDLPIRSLDAHGQREYVGTRAVEIYENQMLNPVGGGGQTIGLFGGGGVVFNNTERGYSIFLYLDEEGTVEKCWPHDLWIWNNDVDLDPFYYVRSNGPLQDVDYFLYEKPNYSPYPYPHPLVSGIPIHTLNVKTTPIVGVPFNIRRVSS